MTDWLPESIQHLAAEEMQKDWNDLRFQSVFYDAYIIGGEYVKAYADLRIDTIEKQLAELQDKLRWRDVREELPDEFQKVLGYRPESSVDELKILTYRRKEFSGAFTVTHWLPLPDAPCSPTK